MLTLSSPALPRQLVVVLAVLAVSLCVSSRADAIVNGTPAPAESASARSTVFVQTARWSCCSGTLVAPDLVLAAGHCVEGKDVEPDPPLHPRFHPLPQAEWQRPDRFYAVPGGATVSVGIDRDEAT